MSSEPREVNWLGGVDVSTYEEKVDEILDLYNENPEEEIELYLNSPGGEIDIGVNFYELMKIKGVNLTVIGLGKVGSAAVMIFLAGKDRFAGNLCKFTFHNGRTNLNGEFTLSELQQITQRMSAGAENVTEIIRKETDLSSSEVEQLKSEGKVLSASEALEAGIISEIKEI